MKLKLTNIKIAGRDCSKGKPFKMHIPTDIDSMTVHAALTGDKPPTEANALQMYIRTNILYGYWQLTYDVHVLTGQDALTAETYPEISYNIDIIDDVYDTYRVASFELYAPSEMIIDDNSSLFADNCENIEQFIFEALLNQLPIEATEIVL